MKVSRWSAFATPPILTPQIQICGFANSMSSCECNGVDSVFSVKEMIVSLISDVHPLSSFVAVQKLQFLTILLNEYVNIINGGHGKFTADVCSVLKDSVSLLVFSQQLKDYLVDKILGDDKLLQYSSSKTFHKLCLLDEKSNQVEKLAVKVFTDCTVDHKLLLGFVSFVENCLTEPSYLLQESVENKPGSCNECKRKCTINICGFVNVKQQVKEVLIQYLPKILSNVEDANTFDQLFMSILRVLHLNLDGKPGNIIHNWLLDNPVSVLNLFVNSNSSLAWEKGAFLVHEIIAYRDNYIEFKNSVPKCTSEFTLKILKVLVEDETLGNVPISKQWRGFGGCDIEVDSEDGYDQLENSEFLEASKPLLQNVSLCVFSSLATQAKGLCCRKDLDSPLNEVSAVSLATMAEKFDTFLREKLLLFGQKAATSNWIVDLFKDQDDALASALLYCLEFEIYISRCGFELGASKRNWNSQHLFGKFVETIGYDHSVLMDLLISEETCFLFYILRYLKMCNSTDIFKPRVASRVRLVDYDSTDEDSDSERENDDLPVKNFRKTGETLHQLHNEIEKVHEKSLFPFNPSPLLLQLKLYNKRFYAIK